MSRLGDVVPDGRYLLDNSVLIDIESEGDRLFIKMNQWKNLEITTSVQEQDSWKIWYRGHGQEASGTINKYRKS